jgi:hypothetical protein
VQYHVVTEYKHILPFLQMLHVVKSNQAVGQKFFNGFVNGGSEVHQTSELSIFTANFGPAQIFDKASVVTFNVYFNPQPFVS